MNYGGGWPAVAYTLRKAVEAGGVRKLWRAMRSRNTCKTCAVGMGGQSGGMVNEAGHFPEVCKKSLQAMVADMQPAIPDDFWKRHPVSRLKSLTPRELEQCGRLVAPVRLRKGANNYEPVTWEEALDSIADTLAATPADESFWYFSGRSSNEAGFLLQLFARLYGTNNVNNCSYYCHQASGVGLSSVTGSGTATVVLDDLEKADLVFLIGGNPASNHPRLMRSLMEVRRRGGNVIVVNPIRETGLERFAVPSDPRSLFFGSDIASLFVQPDIGGDLAFLYGVMKRLVEIEAADKAFLNANCTGWEELSGALASMSWDDIIRRSGVARQEIVRVADLYASSDRAIFAWTMGITHHRHGVENVQAIANLALMRGMVGAPGCGLMPIRGHSNVQGVGSVGVTPRLKGAILKNLETQYGLKLPETEGMDTMACMEAAAEGRLSFGFCLGGNLYGSNPDLTFASRALGSLGTMVYVSTTLNTGHAYGTAHDTFILPVLARDEEPQPTTQESMFNFVRMSDGGAARLVGPRSEVEVIGEIASRTLARLALPTGDISWESLRDTAGIRQMIASVVPGFGDMKNIDNTRREFQIDGRTFHAPRFATTDGRARLHVHTPPLREIVDDSLIRMMTIRSEGQFNTVVYEEADAYRGVSTRDVILMHPLDLLRFNLVDGDRVTVRGPAGVLKRIRATAFDRIKAGNAAMYYPEANILVDRTVDPQSRTPAFKDVVVSISSPATASA